MKQLPLALSLLLAALLIAGALLFAGTSDTTAREATNVRFEGATQVIDISAKGGYFPKVTQAQAGVPTVLRLTTSGTYDCSAAIRIPTLGVNTVLEPTGVVEVAVPPQEPNTTLAGTCAMGMYGFSVRFI